MGKKKPCKICGQSVYRKYINQHVQESHPEQRASATADSVQSTALKDVSASEFREAVKSAVARIHDLVYRDVPFDVCQRLVVSMGLPLSTAARHACICSVIEMVEINRKLRSELE